MKKAYNQMFWGIIITLFNFRIGYINLLPNILGYILILSACNNLVKNSQSDLFDNAYNLSIILLILLSIGDLLQLFPLYGNLALFSIIFFVLVSILNLYFYYDLLLVSNKYIDNNFDNNKLNLFLIGSLISIVILTLSSFLYNDYLTLLYFIIGFSLKIYLLFLISRLKIHYHKNDK